MTAEQAGGRTATLDPTMAAVTAAVVAIAAAVPHPLWQHPP
jgi:hypothetical protein